MEIEGCERYKPASLLTEEQLSQKKHWMEYARRVYPDVLGGDAWRELIIEYLLTHSDEEVEALKKKTSS